MEEITLRVQRDEQSSCLAAWWDDPDGMGGITTQGQDLRDLQQQITEAVARITWDGGVIAPEEFQEFEVSLGPLPDTDRMVFKALQTYSNGDVVRWIDLPTPGGKDPDHPAPVLTLTAAQPDATTTSSTGAPAAAAAPAASAGDGGTGLESWAGPALAGGGIVLALLLLARRRRPAAT